MGRFSQLGISVELERALKEMGIVQPTAIQEKAIPIVIKGKDCIAQAQTGTGKTMAFLLPIVERIDQRLSNIQALIVAPTRELALQITTELKKVIQSRSGINVLAVYGGQDVERQIKKLGQSIHIVVGTPGRIIDHLERGTLRLSNISTLVLDEADQMLHIGFLNEIEEIIRRTPSKRQTLLFSATMPGQVQSLARKYMRQPERIHIRGKQVTVEEVKQFVVETTDRKKQATLQYIMDQYRPFLAIIFCRTKRRASKLNESLKEQGYQTDELHGDLSQSKREQVMERFRKAEIQFLVATDVAARGLDVEGVTHVINYDIPHDVESYIHRIGRTGRAGGEGMAITLVTPRDRLSLRLIEKGIKTTIKRKSFDALLEVPESKPKEKREKAPAKPTRGVQKGRNKPTATRSRSGNQTSIRKKKRLQRTNRRGR
ncbi:MAG: DEAD/DEAH box helicase [Tuberibacillus sp.]